MKISFWASLPVSASAISVDGNGAGRVKFDIPETELEAVLQLTKLVGRAFRVTIEETGEV
jgi:hypothetical protein